jgi:hypothetical protein
LGSRPEMLPSEIEEKVMLLPLSLNAAAMRKLQ